MAKNDNNSSKNSGIAALPTNFVQAPAAQAKPQTMAAVQANKQNNSGGNGNNTRNTTPTTAGTMRIPGQPIPTTGSTGFTSPTTAGTMRVPGQPIPKTNTGTNRPVAPDLGVDNSLKGGNKNPKTPNVPEWYTPYVAPEASPGMHYQRQAAIDLIKANPEWINDPNKLANLIYKDKSRGISSDNVNIEYWNAYRELIGAPYGGTGGVDGSWAAANGYSDGTGGANSWVHGVETVIGPDGIARPTGNTVLGNQQATASKIKSASMIPNPNDTGMVEKVDKYNNFSPDALKKNINLLTKRNQDLLKNPVDPAIENWIKKNEPNKKDYNNPDQYLRAKARFLETVDFNFGAGSGSGADYERWRKKNGNGNGGGDGSGGGDDGGTDGFDVDEDGLLVVPGKPDPKDPTQMNVVDYAGNIVRDPTLFFREDDPNTPENESMYNQDYLKEMKREAGTIDESGGWSVMASQTPGTTAGTNAVAGVTPQTANSYDVQGTQAGVAGNQLTAAQGVLGAQSQVQAAQADMQGLGTGVNQDGSINYAGEALKKYAAQDISNIIDTSTVAGKLLAQSLGEGNYTDSKATLKGQLEVLQSEFVDPNTGEARIPSWAAATARNVSKIAAFKGMTGTAATAAMSQALLEASIPIAQADAQFFQTLTIQNLTNRQQSVINTANTLAKFEQTNVDNRMAAAIQNAKSFVDMDMKNLDNEQQSRVINNQSMIQSILEDAKQENAKRLFVADNQNEMDKFYDNLNTQISQFNSSQTLDASKFNATMADSREKFYKEMQYNINVSNAKWRQTVEVQEDAQQFEAAATDVKNMYDIGVNQLNQIWDRSDALLDYAWQSSEKQRDRKSAVALAVLQGQMAQDAANTEALGALAGLAVSDILNLSGRASGSTILGWLG